ncbi:MULTISPECIES: hypothetical protein [Williamsia]|uniref:hypothetical protein n=1 Tax=Williamsia TaxID=85043 RepID=UPI0003D29FFD|nr:MULTISPECIES: hypothetical protein [Williamsia]ETD30846.1 hypothetical protein W823_22410 [Williamsia sp. D3]PVY23343.1 hypothetical protein C7458_1279 [Williamsia marianensis]PZT97911.1 MAG: hypothetical protein DI630_20610 [Gordonia sp. (in: high G+C Gram-positive bacteria)]
MLIDWSGELDAYLDRLEEAAKTDPEQRKRLDLILAELKVLDELTEPPTEETATLKRVRQSRRFPVWRVAHPFREGIAVRLIVWFTDDNRAVVALFAGDKARMGDVFYDSVGPRADAAVQAWLMQTKDEEVIGDG